jgi:hypothetical protein
VAAGGVVITEAGRREANMARVNDESMKMIATTVVIFPRTVGVLIDPNTACPPPPPKAEPMSAPLPAWRRTTPMIMRLTSTWTTTSAIYIA